MYPFVDRTLPVRFENLRRHQLARWWRFFVNARPVAQVFAVGSRFLARQEVPAAVAVSPQRCQVVPPVSAMEHRRHVRFWRLAMCLRRCMPCCDSSEILHKINWLFRLRFSTAWLVLLCRSARFECVQGGPSDSIRPAFRSWCCAVVGLDRSRLDKRDDGFPAYA